MKITKKIKMSKIDKLFNELPDTIKYREKEYGNLCIFKCGELYHCGYIRKMDSPHISFLTDTESLLSDNLLVCLGKLHKWCKKNGLLEIKRGKKCQR